MSQNTACIIAFTAMMRCDAWWGSNYCPEGLVSNGSADSLVCFYTGTIPGDDVNWLFNPESEKCEDVFEGRVSKFPLIFHGVSHAGSFNTQAQFMDELGQAMQDSELLHDIALELGELEMKKNKTFATYVKDVLHHAHELGDNFKPVEFLVVHAGLHAVLEVGVHTLEVAAHAAIHGAAELAMVIPIVGYVLVAPMLMYDIYTAYHHYKAKTHHAKDFAARLVLKSDCMEERIKITRQDAAKKGFLRPEFGDVCGQKDATRLAKQVQRANFEMVKMMGAFEEVGRCLWPHGERAWSKANCVAAIYEPLREANGKIGILFGAVAAAASYARTVDDILSKPAYGDEFGERFGVDVPENASTQMELLANLTREDLVHRVVGCMQILAVHRAFERLFQRLTLGIKVWMQTYARELKHRDMRTLTYSNICKRVFHKVKFISKTYLGGKDICKDEQFLVGHGDDTEHFGEDEPCTKESELDFGHGGIEGSQLWPENDDHDDPVELSLHV
jgi:hypothetical protein